MATFLSAPTSDRGMKSLLDFKKSHDTPREAPHKTSGKPTKSNITAVTMPKDPSADEEDDGSDDSDESAFEDDESAEDEPDVSALSGARVAGVNHKIRRLAGYNGLDKDADEDDMNPTTYSVVGDDSQDDDYADVEDVSDGEDSTVDVGEDTILRFAEQDLIQEFEQAEQRNKSSLIFEGLTEMDIEDDDAVARRLNLHGGDVQHETEDFSINLDEDPFAGVQTNESLYSDMLQDAELAIWRMPHGERKNSDTSATAQKRVRFEETRSRASSNSDSEDDNDQFPDLFAHEDDPLLKQRLALANAQEAEMTVNDFHDAESVFDFDGEEEKYAFELDEYSSSDEDESSSDSEDDGDTTDEETPEEQLARMLAMKKALGKPASAPSTPATARKVVLKASRTSTAGRAAATNSEKGPLAGTFRLDPTRASMSANAAGTKIRLRPPITPSEKEKGFWERAKTANSSRHGSPQNSSYLTIASPSVNNNNNNNNVPSRPFTAQSTLGSMFDGKLDIIRNNDVSGIAEDLYPAMMVRPESSFVASTATEPSDEEDQDLDMADFIDMDFSASENEDETSMADISSPQQGSDMFGSFGPENGATPKPGLGLLEHLSQCRNIVGSFRRNQTHARHVSSLASHPAKRASASEYNALQKGRRAAGNSPMTPARKSRANSDLSNINSSGVKKSVSSPLASRRPRSRGDSVGDAINRAAALQQTLSSSPFK